MTAEAIDLPATKPRAPLQIQLHLTLALEADYRTDEQPVMAALVESVPSGQFDDLELMLTRHGYHLMNRPVRSRHSASLRLGPHPKNAHCIQPHTGFAIIAHLAVFPVD